MDPEILRRLRGGVELAADATEAALGATAAIQQTITRQIYAPFALLGPLAAPAFAVEQIQGAITEQVYQAVRSASRLVACSAVAILDSQAERR